MILRAFRNGGRWLGSAGAALALALTVGLGLGVLGCAGALREKPGAELGVPRALEGDVSAGYHAYATTLQRWGRWSADPLYAVRWCPSGIDPSTFVPYRADGHWSPSAGDAKAWGAPPGAPFWLSDDSETWGDITMHHGWWVHIEEGAPQGAWCWIPGAAETAGRVVWRSADGFVGWAPEPPTEEDADDAEVDDSAWSYELLGTLFDEVLDPALLVDDAAAVARAATRAARRDPANPARPRRFGPPSTQVATARKALSGYVLAHPEVASDGVGSNAKEGRAATPTTVAHATEPSSSFTSSSAISSAPSSRVSTTSGSVATSTHASSEEALPPSMVLYDQILRDPFLGGMGAGPAGMGPGLIGGIAPSPYLPFLSPAVRTAAGTGGSVGASASRSYGSSYATSHTGSSSAGHSSSHSSSTSSSSSGSSGKSHGK
jgi:hypothetical protein